VLLPLFPLNASFISTPVPSGSATAGPAQLISLSETSLPLVGTLLPVVVNNRSNATVPTESGNQPELTIALLPGGTPFASQSVATTAGETTAAGTSASISAPASSAGQSLLTPATKLEVLSEDETNDKGVDRQAAGAAPQASSPPLRLLLDVDAVFEEIRKETQPATPRGDEPEPAPESRGGNPDPSPPTPEAVDAAIQSLGAEPPQSRTGYRRASWGPQPRFNGSVPVGTAVVLSTMVIVRASPPAERLGRRTRAGAAPGKRS
jgi:hypothetical protein